MVLLVMKAAVLVAIVCFTDFSTVKTTLFWFWPNTIVIKRYTVIHLPVTVVSELIAIIINRNTDGFRQKTTVFWPNTVVLGQNTVVFGQNTIVNEQVPVLMSAVDCLLLTSLAEGSPNVIKEALACNLPIVSVNVGDVAERLNNVEHCYLVNYDYQEIASAVTKVLQNDKVISIQKYVEGLEINSIADKIINFYDDIFLYTNE